MNFFLSPVHQLEAIDMTEVGEVTEVRTNSGLAAARSTRCLGAGLELHCWQPAGQGGGEDDLRLQVVPE